jgi:hypothetical protein
MPGLEKKLAATIDKALVRNPRTASRMPGNFSPPFQAHGHNPIPANAQIMLAESPENRHISPMKAVKPQSEKCKTKPAPQTPLFGHLKPLPQSLSPEERTSQFLQNNRLASSRKPR